MIIHTIFLGLKFTFGQIKKNYTRTKVYKLQKYFSLVLISVLLLFALLSCGDGKEDQDQWTKDRVKIVLDSINSSGTIACFKESFGFSVLEYDTGKIKVAKKLTYRKGYPVFIDSLVCIKYDKFKSEHLNTTYLIKDSTVILINYAKIIHPSSNWQGQTPWAQPYVTTCIRLDLKSQ